MDSTIFIAQLPDIAHVRRDSDPMHRQLYDMLKTAILNGTLRPGIQLPPTRAFAELAHVSRQTVLTAITQLAAEGFVTGYVGRGTFVSSNLPRPVASDKARGHKRPHDGQH